MELHKQIPNTVIFVCKCKKPKKYRLRFDGGSTGFYELELCADCYEKEDKQHMVGEKCL